MTTKNLRKCKSKKHCGKFFFPAISLLFTVAKIKTLKPKQSGTAKYASFILYFILVAKMTDIIFELSKTLSIVVLSDYANNIYLYTV